MSKGEGCTSLYITFEAIFSLKQDTWLKYLRPNPCNNAGDERELTVWVPYPLTADSWSTWNSISNPTHSRKIFFSIFHLLTLLLKSFFLAVNWSTRISAIELSPKDSVFGSLPYFCCKSLCSPTQPAAGPGCAKSLLRKDDDTEKQQLCAYLK